MILTRFLFLSFLFSSIHADPSPNNSMSPDHLSSNAVLVRLVGPGALPGSVVASPRMVKSDEAWRKQLGQQAYEVLRAKGTEPAFCGNLLDNHKQGIYFCAGCDLPLFSSQAKFQSGTGWPSFFQPYASENIVTQRDSSHGMIRDEILCARCGGHLGHVFNDGPAPTGLRYCLNAAALVFRDEATVLKDANNSCSKE